MKRKITFVCLIFAALMLAACGEQENRPVEGSNYYYPKENNTESSEIGTDVAEQIAAVFESDIYMIVSNDMATEQMVLKQMTSGKQYLFYYSLTTSFLDKYGNNTSVTEFSPGRMITIGEKDTKGKLKEACLTDEVWEYAEVVRFSIDEERGVFTIADTKYSYDEDVFVVSNDRKIKLSDIDEEDELFIVGMNKEILSVSVTTGQGSISLKNTEIFEGSFIQVGQKIFAEITGEITLPVPEGTYTVTVANKGYGGSKEIVVARGENTEIDLDELKGEGPKKGLISFVITDENDNELDAKLKIDGKEVSYEDEIQMDYGIHSLQIFATGFEKFAKKLFVNSENATITIALSEESDESEVTSSESSSSSSSTNLAGSQAGSLTSGNSSSSSSSGNSLTDEQMSDYLSTFTELLGNVMD